MRALLFDRELRVANDHPDPVLQPGEALVTVRLAGICNTDLEIVRGYQGFQGVLGHEFVGEVLAASESGWVGWRVVGEINAPCRHCETCETVSGNHCPDRTVLGIVGRDGAMAEFLRLPIANLHRIPDELTDEQAIFVEPLAAAYQILDRVLVRPSDRVFVLGDGKLGQLVARVLATVGARVTAIGRHESKLALLRAAGVDARLVDDLLVERGDVVVDCTGSAAGLADAIRLTRPRGTLVLKSTVADGVTINLAPIVVNEISVIGSRCGPFAPAIRALVDGRIDVRPLLSEIVPLHEGVRAFGRAAERGVMKVAIRP
jgi:alcohol dehydrogenase